MPALDRLQAELGSDKFEVVALSVDKAGLDGAKKFLADIKAENLEALRRSDGQGRMPLKVIGMPTTILIERKDARSAGCGPAKWDSAEAKKLIEAQLN